MTAGPVAASFTFTRRSLLRIRHVPEQLLDATVFPVMFTVMFTYVFGGAIAGSPSAYLRYALPGILTQTVLFITMYTATTLNSDIDKGVLDRFRSQPVWRPALLVGALLGDTVRYALATTSVVGTAALIGYRAPGGLVGIAAVAVLLFVFCFALSWVWLIVALVVRTPGAVMGVAVMVLFPSTFVSSVFAPPETMRPGLRRVVDANPVTWFVEAARGLLDGTPDAGAVALVLVVSAGMTAAFAPVALYLYNRRC